MIRLRNHVNALLHGVLAVAGFPAAHAWDCKQGGERSSTETIQT
jgi:hypothetical protein